MTISIRKYQQSDKNIWDSFVDKANNGVLFHYRDFLSYHIGREFNDHSLIFTKNNKLVAIFPAAEVERDGKKILYSHPGTSYGGFVTNTPGFGTCSAMIESFDIYCKNNGFNEIFFIPPPLSYSKIIDETLDYVLLRNEYKNNEIYISSVINIEDDVDAQLQQTYKNKKRSKSFYKRLILDNNVTFEWAKNYAEFYPILVDNKKRLGAKPTHTLDELYLLDKQFPNHFHLLMMYSNKKPVGGTLNFVANSNTAIVFYNMIDYNFKSLQPATLQMFETIKWAKRNGFYNLDFGVSQLPSADDPLTPSPNLIRFKEEFGAQAVIRKSFRKLL